MENSTYYAHASNTNKLQTVQSHLYGTASLAKKFAVPFGGEGQAELAGMTHDLGKYTEAFQRRLQGEAIQVDHSTAGAIECWKRGQYPAAFAVAGHHGGLPNGGSQTDKSDQATLFGRLKKKEEGRLEPYEIWEQEITLPQMDALDFKKRTGPEWVFYTRMLYSCLVDADFLDTETFMDGQSRQVNETSIEQLWDKLQNYISDWFPPKGELNTQRCRILEQCRKEGEQQSQGLFSLTVPTGGGKTVASLTFALAHARKHGLQRIIYVIPYTSIIEQTAETFRTILGAENVLEHHSNLLYDIEEANSQTIQMAKATENWDMPVIVTTAVQFFESLYAYRSSQCRKLHNIAGSVVIFDEAQMLPIPYLRPCVWAISQLVKSYHVSAVLCTATQPALAPAFREFLPTVRIKELCPPDTCQWEFFRRVTIQQVGRLTWDELAERLQTCSQVLCIVNTRKAAQEIFEKLGKDGSFHLSTLMYPNHRKRQLAEIRHRLKEGLPCRVVSTSLIEAGVDVDFPTVYRELAGLDSILQAAGRCNREGKRSVQESIVAIFEGEGKVPPLFSAAIGAGKHVMIHHTDITSSEAIHDYFHELLEVKGKAAQDKERILSLLSTEFFPFRIVAERFQLIDTPTRTVYIPLGEGAELVEQLRSGVVGRRLFQQLGQYGVSIYEKHFVALNESGDIEILENGNAILYNTALYSNETGLSLKADSGKGLFV